MDSNKTEGISSSTKSTNIGRVFLNKIANSLSIYDSVNDSLEDFYEFVKDRDKNKDDLFHLIDSIHTIDRINLIILIIGILANILCIGIFAQKNLLKRKFNWYLLIISVFEFIFCSTLAIDYAHRLLDEDILFLHNVNMINYIIIDFIIHTSDSFTIILTLILTIDRLYAIFYPIKIKHFMTNTKSKSLTLTAFIIVSLIKVSTAVNCHLCEQNQEACTIYCIVLSPLILNILPVLIISTLNSILIVKIVKYNAKASSITGTRVGRNSVIAQRPPIKNRRKSYHIMIATMALWFLVTNIPYYLVLAYQYRYEITDSDHVHLTSILFNLNHCITFFIYVSFHDLFRKKFLEIFSFFKLSSGCCPYFKTKKQERHDFV
jgi:hypothetical protein